VFNYFNEDVVIEPDYKEERKNDGKGTSMFDKINPKLHGKHQS
jgi:hypothetical protein